MCGIAGIFNPRRDDLALEVIKPMTDIIRYRGPDDEGYLLFAQGQNPIVAGGGDTPTRASATGLRFAPSTRIEQELGVRGSLAFGHRRLSIIDLSPLGHQPMCTRDGRYWIVYNGEIYNHVELRATLQGRGHEFVSHSDTEVILAAYAEWGESFQAHMNGMWAICIYDRVNEELFLSRDRFGIKPLYYWITDDGTIAFGSEIKQFTVLPGWRANMNPQRVYDFLAWGLTDHTDETLFDRVFQLRPGHCLKITRGTLPLDASGRLPSTKWFELLPRPFTGSMLEAEQAFRELFFDSIRLHLRADVPIGSCLSGGLDSSSVVCVINQLLHEQSASAMQKTFSACSDVAVFDERPWIEEVVRATGVAAHYIYPDVDGLLDSLPLITWHQDEPFGSTSNYAQWRVFKLAAASGVRVMLDGQGADEQLAGYHSYFGPRFAQLLLAGRVQTLWREIRATKRLHGYSEIRAAMQIANVLLPNSLRQNLRSWLGLSHARPAWLSLEVLGATPKDPLSDLGARVASVQSMSRAQLTSTNLQMLLHWEDRDSMAHSIEARVPFLDYRLVEFVLGLPDEYKIADGVTKRVQRGGLSGILPDRIRDRADKLGFVTPEAVWLKERAPDRFRKKLHDSVDASGGILNGMSITLVDEIIKGAKPFSFIPWRLISFGAWVERFSVRQN